jgi:hypothetical protein
LDGADAAADIALYVLVIVNGARLAQIDTEQTKTNRCSSVFICDYSFSPRRERQSVTVCLNSRMAASSFGSISA